MPTPSSGQPPGPSSQLPTPGFTTCPDDLQPSSARETEDETGSGQLQSHEDHEYASRQSPLPVAFVDPIRSSNGVDTSQARDFLIASEGTTSLGTSSRATTMSPRPRSSATTRTSPVSETISEDLNKRTQVDDHVSLGRNTTEQPRSSMLPSGRCSPEQSQGTTSLFADVASTTIDDELYAPSTGSDFPSLRTTSTSPSSFLRPGSRFLGTQQSERQVYDVQVEIKHVDMRESFLCGYLRIQGLTEDHPTLTTYFEGEIIGSKYNFFTNHESWGANRKTDLKHWKRFSAFHPYRKQVEKGPASVSNVSERENIFMRWKEHFLVPDHRVRTITGASFEGFYYICFNQIKGEVSGIYFHSKSEKFQELELKHVPDRGCFSAVEFR